MTPAAVLAAWLTSGAPGAPRYPEHSFPHSLLAAGLAPAAPGPALAPPTVAPGAAATSTVHITPPAAPGVAWTVPIAHAAGVLISMRLTLSVLWPQAYDPFPVERSAHHLGAAFRSPPELRRDRALLESDGDPWAINVVGHGLFGAEIYGRVRQCGGAPWQALAFAAGTSAVWEYGIESWSKRPSAIDLIATPLIGAALGEARFHAQRWLHRRSRGFFRTVGEILVDPLGQAERGILQTRC